MDRDNFAHSSTYELKLRLWTYVQQHLNEFPNRRQVLNELSLSSNSEEVLAIAQRFQIPWTSE